MNIHVDMELSPNTLLSEKMNVKYSMWPFVFSLKEKHDTETHIMFILTENISQRSHKKMATSDSLWTRVLWIHKRKKT